MLHVIISFVNCYPYHPDVPINPPLPTFLIRNFLSDRSRFLQLLFIVCPIVVYWHFCNRHPKRLDWLVCCVDLFFFLPRPSSLKALHLYPGRSVIAFLDCGSSSPPFHTRIRRRLARPFHYKPLIHRNLLKTSASINRFLFRCTIFEFLLESHL